MGADMGADVDVNVDVMLLKMMPGRVIAKTLCQKQRGKQAQRGPDFEQKFHPI